MGQDRRWRPRRRLDQPSKLYRRQLQFGYMDRNTERNLRWQYKYAEYVDPRQKQSWDQYDHGHLYRRLFYHAGLDRADTIRRSISYPPTPLNGGRLQGGQK